MRKRILSLLITITLLTGAGHMTGFALTETGSQEPSSEPAAEEQANENSEQSGSTEETVPEQEAAEPVEMAVSCTDVTTGSASVKWDAVEGAAYYSVIVNDAEPVYVEPKSLNYKLSGLKSDNEYQVTVSAFNSADAVIGSGLCIFVTEVKRPAKVRSFRTVSGYLSVMLRWKRASGVDGYKIYWKGSNGTKGTISNIKRKTTKYKFKISDKNREVKYTFRIVAVKDGVESKKVAKSDKAVQLMKFKVTLKPRRGGYALKSHDRFKTVTYRKLKAGDTIETIGFIEGKYIFQKMVKGRLRTFYVLRISTKNPRVAYIGKYEKKANGTKIVQPVYSKEEAESFVNAIGVASNTRKMIWVNQYSQRVFIFRGSKGKWKLEKVCKKDADGGAGWLVATGRPDKPTTTGATSIKDKMRSNGAPYWNVTAFFSLHGNIWGSLGWPISGACTRNTNEHAGWIYSHCGLGTRVYVY